MYLHVHSLQVAKFKAPLFQLVAFLCPIRNSPVRLSCRVGLMSGTANEGHLGVASSLAYIYISIKYIIILLYQCVCIYIYIKKTDLLGPFMHLQNNAVGLTIPSW